MLSDSKDVILKQISKQKVYLLRRICGTDERKFEKTKEIVLMHISEEANNPEVALGAYKEIFALKGMSKNSIKFSVANQWKSLLGGRYEN